MITAGLKHESRLVAYKNAGFTFALAIVDDDTGLAIKLTGHTLKFIVAEDDEQSIRFSLDTPTDVAISGASGNAVTITGTDTRTGVAGQFRWTLRDSTSDRVLARGPFDIEATANA